MRSVTLKSRQVILCTVPYCEWLSHCRAESPGHRSELCRGFYEWMSCLIWECCKDRQGQCHICAISDETALQNKEIPEMLTKRRIFTAWLRFYLYFIFSIVIKILSFLLLLVSEKIGSQISRTEAVRFLYFIIVQRLRLPN